MDHLPYTPIIPKLTFEYFCMISNILITFNISSFFEFKTIKNFTMDVLSKTIASFDFEVGSNL